VRAAIEAHVAGCARCETFNASYREAPRIVREATSVEMPADLEASLLAAIRAARGGARRRDEYRTRQSDFKYSTRSAFCAAVKFSPNNRS
jgi:hypothetical protein